MWSFLVRKADTPLPVTLSDTLGGKRPFTKSGNGPVTMYSCGPTVYGPQHIGNLRAAVFSDTVARTLSAAGYRVKRVTNITDVGHLVGDGDEGEDKMAVGAKRDGTTPEEIADRYTNRYLDDIRALNIDTNDIRFPRATLFIDEQIEMIRKLEKKGLAYRTSDGVYFDTAKFPDYGMLGNVKQVSLQAGKRVAVGDKRSEHDFVLWRKAKENDLQQWDSPWMRGNPGWSIECSAMATSILGPTIDIHTGGQDHIQVHHNNEIAQSEGATGRKPFSRFWLHNAFLTIGGEKISKSLGNTYTLDDVKARGIHPLALRFLFLQAHYRTPLSFTWESLEAAEIGLKSLWKIARYAEERSGKKGVQSGKTAEVLKRFHEEILNDFGSPMALAVLFGNMLMPGYHTMGNLTPEEMWHVLGVAENALGLSLTKPPPPDLFPKELTLEQLPSHIQTIAKNREKARLDRDFDAADRYKKQIGELTIYEVRDATSGTTYIQLKPDSWEE